MAIIVGNNLPNNLVGTASPDTIVGRAGNDQLFGNGGNDRLNGGTQNDRLNGGAGIDTADYSNIVIGGTTYIGASAGVRVNLGLAGAQDTVGAGTDTLVSIENLTGTTFNDTLTGNAGNNMLNGLAGHDTLNGGRGNDQLYGRSGDDQLFGGNGNDLLTGGSGNDTLNGGAGIDTASYATASAGVTVNLDFDTEGQAQNTGGGGIDTLLNIESLTGSNFNDNLSAVWHTDNGTLNGGAGNDSLFTDHGSNFTLNGETGNDSLFAVECVDVTLNGGTGNDRLEAAVGHGSSTLNGGDGNDVLVISDALSGASTMNGGTGADTMYASFGGVDIFDYNSASDSPAGAGRDVIHNFNESFDHDQIDLTTIDANTTVFAPGNQAFTYIGGAAFSSFFGIFTPGQLRYAGGVMSGNTDFDAAAEFEIQLVGAPALVVGVADTDILL